MMLSLIIPIYKQINFTLSCLNDLSKIDIEKEVIIVDNCPEDTKDKLSSFPKIKNYKYIVSDFNSFSHACNLGYNNSSGNYVLFLNNDIKIKEYKNCFDNIIKTLDKNDFCLTGPSGGFIDKNYNFVYETKDNSKKINYISGWCLAGSKNTFEKIKLLNKKVFDEDFKFYFEDTELSFRAVKKGAKLILSDVPIVHFGKISTNKNLISKLYIDGRKIFMGKVK